jgi:hypothetical protein
MPWKHDDLTAQASAPAAASRSGLVGYTTSLAGQGPVARVAYEDDDRHVHELFLTGGGRWKHTDLTVEANAPTGVVAMVAYTTSLAGQGPVARVAYLGGDQHVHELLFT